MRGLRSLLAAAIFISPILAAHAQEAVSYFGFAFPLKIGALTRGEVTEFEKTSPGAGYGIRYAGGGIRVDIFVYDSGKRRISWDVFHPDQKEEFETSVRAVHLAKERGLYRDVKEGPEFETPAVKNPFFRCKVFTINRSEGRTEDSVLCLGAQNNKFFKTRITFVPGGGANVAERAEKLVLEIGRAAKF